MRYGRRLKDSNYELAIKNAQNQIKARIIDVIVSARTTYIIMCTLKSHGVSLHTMDQQRQNCLGVYNKNFLRFFDGILLHNITIFLLILTIKQILC